MACDEIAALRLALMNVLGGGREAERRHEEAEIGQALLREGPIRGLAAAGTLEDARHQLEAAVVELEERQARMAPDDPKLPYTRTLLVTVKAAEATFRRLCANLENFHRSLEDTHDLIHEIYPPS